MYLNSKSSLAQGGVEGSDLSHYIISVVSKDLEVLIILGLLYDTKLGIQVLELSSLSHNVDNCLLTFTDSVDCINSEVGVLVHLLGKLLVAHVDCGNLGHLCFTLTLNFINGL